MRGVDADRRDRETTEDEPTRLPLREKERREAATATGAAPISSPRVRSAIVRARASETEESG